MATLQKDAQFWTIKDSKGETLWRGNSIKVGRQWAKRHSVLLTAIVYHD